MNPEQDYGRPPVGGSFENALETWERLCEVWSSTLHRAQDMGNSSEAARAELTLEMCERERSRVEALFSRRHG